MTIKLPDLLSQTLQSLFNTRQYGVTMAQHYQNQIAHDPSQVISLQDVDGRQTSVQLLAKGSRVRLDLAFQAAIAQQKGVELDAERGGGVRFEAKGLIFTVTWRKRTSAERIQDTKDRVLTPTGRLSFPSLGVVDEKKARHAANYAIGGPIKAADYSALEERLLAHYGSGISVSVQEDGRVIVDLESHPPRQAFSQRWATEQPVNCRCAIVKEAPKRRSIEVLATSLKQPRRENTLPRDMQSGGGVVLKVVGSSYRTQRQQDVLRSKNIGNMVLLAHEPDNDHSKHAIAVFAWANGQDNYWHHVGYIQDALAKGLVDRMRQFGGGDTNRIALKGSFVEDPGLSSNPLIRLDEVWSFPDSLRA